MVCALIEQVEALDGSDRRASSKQFIDARFGDLDPAFATIVGFTFVFAAMMDGAPFGDSVEYLVISATSFVALVLVGSEQITDHWVHLVAEIEDFTGAFLIALLVFTLTRSINR